ncbi:winged helix-turn-helix transcriptional regulator [Candidatus Micrarchaeota archaeon]|nr:winged helix-turn-helix transcriptional regulator [Candidatus Micrarchaeota archaeon]
MTGSQSQRESLEFGQVAKDFAALKEQMHDPVVVGAMLLKLSQERRETNELIEGIASRLEALERKLGLSQGAAQVQKEAANPAVQTPSTARIQIPAQAQDSSARFQSPSVILSQSPFAEERMLCEVDERIVSFISRKGRASASQVKSRLGYRGSNAASSRLNALARQGYLRKIRAGRTVYFTLTVPYKMSSAVSHQMPSRAIGLGKTRNGS